MKQISTKSFKTFILVGKNDEKEVRYYKVGYKGAHAYPRTVPLEKIYKLIDKSTLMHPKMIRNRMKYIDTEYINGNVLKKEDNPEIIKSLVCSFLYNLALIDCSSLKKYRIWSNNSEYLEYQVNNM